MRTLFLWTLLMATPLWADGTACHFSTIKECAGCKVLSHRAAVTNDCTLRPGIEIASGTVVAWNQNQTLQSISGAKHDVSLPAGLMAKAESFIAWYPNGQLKYVDHLAANSQVGSGIWGAEGASVSWYESGSVEWVSRLARDYQGVSGNDAALAPNFARFYEDGTLAFSRPKR